MALGSFIIMESHVQTIHQLVINFIQYTIIIILHRYTQLPRPSTLTTSSTTLPGTSAGPSIVHYFTSVACVGCGAATTAAPTGKGAVGGQGLCGGCKVSPQGTVLRLGERIRTYERAVDHIQQVSCS